jgi:hypothetical protein
MAHSLIGADRGTHCKIVAVALTAAMILVLVGINAAAVETGAATARAPAQVPVLDAGKPVTSAALDATATR